MDGIVLKGEGEIDTPLPLGEGRGERLSAYPAGMLDTSMLPEEIRNEAPPPPVMEPSQALVLGPLRATVEAMLGHPCLAWLAFDGSPDEIWSGLAFAPILLRIL